MATAVNATEVVYRRYRPGDEEAIITFLRECGYTPDLAWWRWINQRCPHGPMLIELAWDGARVVGHYAVLPRRLRVHGVAMRAGQAMQAAVHPQCRGLAVLQGLMRRVVETARAEGLAFLYGFPNEQIWLVYQKLFRWQPMGDIVALERPVGRIEAGADGEYTVSCCERAQFDERYGIFEASQALQQATHAIQDPAYLQWRYAEHPRVRYRLLEAQASSGALTGYVALKRYEKGGAVHGHLIDFGLRDGHSAALRPLVAAAFSLFQRERVEVASCWALPQTPYFNTLRAMGFQTTGFATHMGYRLLDPGVTADRLGRDSWHVMMGDSDAF